MQDYVLVVLNEQLDFLALGLVDVQLFNFAQQLSQGKFAFIQGKLFCLQLCKVDELIDLMQQEVGVVLDILEVALDIVVVIGDAALYLQENPVERGFQVVRYLR